MDSKLLPKPGSILFDNWLLQEVNNILTGDLEVGATGDLVIEYETETHSWADTSKAGCQIESLFQFLTNLVFQEQILIDPKYAYVWQKEGSPLMNLHGLEILDPHQFETKWDELVGIRQGLVKDICLTRSMRNLQYENEKLWEEEEVTLDPYFSQLVWGTAGMMSRAKLLEVGYAGHPLRQRVLEKTSFSSKLQAGAVSKIHEIVRNGRMAIFERTMPSGHAYQAVFPASPVIIEIIESSSTKEDLISVALEMRAEFKKLREWILEYQIALDSQNPKKLLKENKRLREIEDFVAKELKGEKYGYTSLIEWVKWIPGLSNLSNVKIPGMKNLTNKRCVKALINRMIFTPKASQSLRKLYKMFEIKNTTLELEVDSYLHSLSRRSI